MALDREFAKRTEKAFREYRKGGFIPKTKDAFFAELEKW